MRANQLENLLPILVINFINEIPNNQTDCSFTITDGRKFVDIF